VQEGTHCRSLKRGKYSAQIARPSKRPLLGCRDCQTPAQAQRRRSRKQGGVRLAAVRKGEEEGSARACIAPASGSVNQTLPSAPTQTSLGLLNGCPCQLSSSGVAAPLTTSSTTSEPPDLPQPWQGWGLHQGRAAL